MQLTLVFRPTLKICLTQKFWAGLVNRKMIFVHLTNPKKILFSGKNENAKKIFVEGKVVGL